MPPLAVSRRQSSRPYSRTTCCNGSLFSDYYAVDNRYLKAMPRGSDNQVYRNEPLGGEEHHPRAYSPQSDYRFPVQTSPMELMESFRNGDPMQTEDSTQRIPQGHATGLQGNASPVPSDPWSSSHTYHDYGITPKVVTTISSPGNERSDKGHFSSVTKVKLFGMRSKATPVMIAKNDSRKVQELHGSNSPRTTARNGGSMSPQSAPVTSAPHPRAFPPPPPTPATYRYSSFSALSGTISPDSSYRPPATPNSEPWADRSLPTTPATSRTMSTRSGPPSIRSSVSVHRTPEQSSVSSVPPSTKPRDLLPCEANKFQGFCKGAWRAQIGDKKKAMEDRQRPGGMYNAARFWQCTKCKFEGHLLMLDKKTKAVDRRVLTAEGIQFRWDFLFKSHIESKDATSDFLSATFGCMFCTAEGKGTPTFGGAQMLMAHLQEHRAWLPTGEVVYRMNALVGPRARLDEDFDINIVAKDGIDL